MNNDELELTRTIDKCKAYFAGIALDQTEGQNRITDAGV